MSPWPGFARALLDFANPKVMRALRAKVMRAHDKASRWIMDQAPRAPLDLLLHQAILSSAEAAEEQL